MGVTIIITNNLRLALLGRGEHAREVAVGVGAHDEVDHLVRVEQLGFEPLSHAPEDAHLTQRRPRKVVIVTLRSEEEAEGDVVLRVFEPAAERSSDAGSSPWRA